MLTVLWTGSPRLPHRDGRRLGETPLIMGLIRFNLYRHWNPCSDGGPRTVNPILLLRVEDRDKDKEVRAPFG